VRVPSTIRRATSLGLPANPRAMKLAPAARARRTGSTGEMPVPSGVSLLLHQSGAVVGEAWPLVHAIDLVVHDHIGHVDIARQACMK